MPDAQPAHLRHFKTSTDMTIHKRASVQPTHDVKQGCPLSPLLFSISINGIGRITEGATGA
eukprot:1134760-Pelagomonas_calceolata.AAC.1